MFKEAEEGGQGVRVMERSEDENQHDSSPSLHLGPAILQLCTGHLDDGWQVGGDVERNVTFTLRWSAGSFVEVK